MKNQNNLEYYLSLPYTFQVQKTEDGYWANVLELDGCHTSADTVEEAYKELEEVLKAHLEIKLEHGDPIPEPVPEEGYSGKFIVRVPKSLHKRLATLAEKEGVSLNQYVMHKLSES